MEKYITYIKAIFVEFESTARNTCIYIYKFIYLFKATAPQWARAASFTRFLDHTQRHTTFSRTPLDE